MTFFLACALTFFLAFYLASILTYFLACMLTYFLAYIKYKYLYIYVRLSKLLVWRIDINIIWKGPIANHSLVAICTSFHHSSLRGVSLILSLVKVIIWNYRSHSSRWWQLNVFTSLSWMNLKKNCWRSCCADPFALPPANLFSSVIESSLDPSVSSFDEVLHQCQVRACDAAKWHQATAPSGTSTSLRGCFPVLAQGVEDVWTMPFARHQRTPCATLSAAQPSNRYIPPPL